MKTSFMRQVQEVIHLYLNRAGCLQNAVEKPAFVVLQVVECDQFRMLFSHKCQLKLFLLSEAAIFNSVLPIKTLRLLHSLRVILVLPGD